MPWPVPKGPDADHAPCHGTERAVMPGNVVGGRHGTANTAVIVSLTVHDDTDAAVDSANITIMDITDPPGPPANLQATSTNTTITLNWDDPDDDTITGYKILSKKASPSGLTVLVNDTGSADTSYTIHDLKPDTAYIFRVIAINEHGESERSAPVHISTQSTPAAPANLQATSTNTTITLNWDDPDDDTITGYRILSKKASQSGLTVLVNDTGSADTSYTIRDLEPGTAYIFRVIAINEHGESERSKAVRVSTPR